MSDQGARAFEELILKWERDLRAACRRALKGKLDAADAYQQVAIKLLEQHRAGKLKDLAYAITTATNLCLDLIRREKRRREVALQDEEGSDDDIHNVYDELFDQSAESGGAWAEALDESSGQDARRIARKLIAGLPRQLRLRVAHDVGSDYSGHKWSSKALARKQFRLFQQSFQDYQAEHGTRNALEAMNHALECQVKKLRIKATSSAILGLGKLRIVYTLWLIGFANARIGWLASVEVGDVARLVRLAKKKLAAKAE